VIDTVELRARVDALVEGDDLVSSLVERDEREGEVTSQVRYMRFRQSQPSLALEFILPRIVRDIDLQWPSYMTAGAEGSTRTREALQIGAKMIGPWSTPFVLAHGVNTMLVLDDADDNPMKRVLYRRSLITATAAALLGDHLSSATVLDIGCNAGFFSMDIAGRGAAHVDGVDLRAQNIKQATWVAGHYGMSNVEFHVSDVSEFALDRQFDVVLNLGVLYHVVDPFDLLRRTYELCRHFAIVDSVCCVEPVSAYFVFGQKDVESATEGRDSFELHPTYRAVIDTIKWAGFRHVVEIVAGPNADFAHRLYVDGRRRCFLAIK
jgi:SAM-dependent methyltransferase